MPFIYTAVSDKDSHFTGAIAQNASEEENITLPTALDGVNGNARGIIRGVTIVSDQGLDWELYFFGSDLFSETSDMDTDGYLGRCKFTATTDGIQIGGTGNFYYYKDGLEIPYLDADKTGELHVALVNRSATGKNAGATGEIVVKVHIEPPAPDL